MNKCYMVIISIVYAFFTFFTPASAQTPPSIQSISDNRSTFTSQAVPKYEKFEISFQLQTAATNLQLPYDPTVIPGLSSGVGVTVNAQFTGPDGQTYTQPAFYYQDYEYKVVNGQDWMYPTGMTAWKVRFAPHQTGSWQYKIIAQDKNGTTQSATSSFVVATSANKGFIKVSSKDARYFEYSDGTYFPGLGYNMNYNQISWENPYSGNMGNFQKMNENGIQLIRMWLSQWSIYGAAGNPWRSAGVGHEYLMLAADAAYQDHDFSLSLDSDWRRLGYGNGDYSSFGWNHRNIGIKPNTKYRVTSRFYTPRPLSCNGGGTNCGYTVKLGSNTPNNDWLDDPTVVNTGVKVTATKQSSGSGWDMVTGEWTSGAISYLPLVYVVMENVDTPALPNQVFIDSVIFQEVLADGSLGPNIIPQATMDHHLNFDHYYSYAFDKVLDLAKQNNVYLKVVGLEKSDYIMNHIDAAGNNILDGDRTTCPTVGDASNCFYGDGSGQITKVAWLQRAWWRYQQARWGYSTNIHSWELLNEGNPGKVEHYNLANAYGQFMHQFKPNDHLVTTSFWSQYPTNFWMSSNYPHIDYADYHRYTTLNRGDDSWIDTSYYDTAKSAYDNGNLYGSKQTGINKPVVRGENGLTDSGTEPQSPNLLTQDPTGIWLHGMVWGGVNHFGIMDVGYWYPQQHIYPISGDGRTIYGAYYRFIQDIPLSNGNYVDAAAVAPSTIRAWGQKDLANKRAHLWIANAAYRWNNKTPPAVANATVTIAGFAPNTAYPIEQWNTYTGTVASTATITANSAGEIVLPVSNLVTDYAVRIGDYSHTTSPTPTPVPTKPGDANGDLKIDGIDYMIWRNHYNQSVTGSSNGDFDNSGRVDGVDYMIWRNNYGK